MEPTRYTDIPPGGYVKFYLDPEAGVLQIKKYDRKTNTVLFLKRDPKPTAETISPVGRFWQELDYNVGFRIAHECLAALQAVGRTLEHDDRTFVRDVLSPFSPTPKTHETRQS
jgi:hypothetical protein